VIESAARLGVELDEREANESVAAMAAESSGGDLVVDVNSGVYGHRVSMLDLQAVYLDADSIPIFSKLVKELSADTVDDYVEALEHEVWKYTVKDPNFGKVARRLYNVFRMNGHYAEAAFIRELFDEPVTALYQVSALIRTLDDASNSGEDFETETMIAQVDKLIMSAIQALDGPEEAVMVGHLLKLRNSVQSRGTGADRAEDMAGVQDAALGAANTYFERALRSVPEIDAYLQEISKRAP
jgi:hypothetical protein